MIVTKLLYTCACSQAAQNSTKSRHKLVDKGVSFSGSGAGILYHTEECLCVNKTECQPPTSHLYPYTMHGLDRMVQVRRWDERERRWSKACMST